MLANRRHSSPSIFKDFHQELSRQHTSSDITAKPRTLSVCFRKSESIKQSIKSPSDNRNHSLISPTIFLPRAELHHDIQPHLKQPPIRNSTNIIKLTSPPKNRMEMKKSKSKCDKPTLAKPRFESTLPLNKKESLSRESEEYTKKIKSKRANDMTLLSPNDTAYLKIFKFEPQRLVLDNNTNSGDEEIALINSRGPPFSPLLTSDFQRSPSPRSPLKTPPTPGVVITSYRLSQRRSSITNAAIAFAAATAGATISPVASPKSGFKFRYFFI